MLLSSYFLPTLKENPIDATVASHQLMIRAGMIRQTSSGIYSWLPLGLRVLRKVERIIRDEMNKSGAQEILMPTIQQQNYGLNPEDMMHMARKCFVSSTGMNVRCCMDRLMKK